MRILKQSTSVKVPVGAMVDATDGATLETAIAWATGEATLIKHDSATIVNIGTNTWSAHLGGGLYNVTLTASDTDTLGLLTIVAHDTAARPVRHDYMVVPANVYDSLIGGSDLLNVNVDKFNENASSGLLTGTDKLRADSVAVSGNETSADNLEETLKGVVTGTVQSGSTSTSIITNLTETQNDHFNDRVIIFTSGVQKYVAAAIADYDGASKTLTVSALPAAPANGSTFVIV